ncbi:halocyanin domain-containing protein [Halobacteriales archaeon QS_1_69_70]|nr:MAG: halocyanin domain-containing protein [Halobacteriales archaeon QS_1_69_70]
MGESTPPTDREPAPVEGTDDETARGRRGFIRAGVGTAVAAGIAGAGGTAAAQAYGGWLSDTSNYEATQDHTGESAVTVAVGAGENGQLFAPPAILVDPGTTVTWEWTGEGSGHTVTHEPTADDAEPAFESDQKEAAGETFQYTFEAEGTFRYFCEPHRSVGMKGVVAVGSTDDDLIEPTAGAGGGGGASAGSGLRSGADLAVLAGAVGLGAGLVLAVLSATDRLGDAT